MKSPTTDPAARRLLLAPIRNGRAAAFCLLALGLSAEASPLPRNLNSLLENSPFWRESTEPVSAPTAQPLEFRGVVIDDEGQLLNIFDPATQRSTWLELNTAINGYSIQSYDPVNEAITITHQGKKLTLTLKRAHVIAQVLPQPTVSGPTALATSTSGTRDRRALLAEIIRKRQAKEPQGTINTDSQPETAENTEEQEK